MKLANETMKVINKLTSEKREKVEAVVRRHITACLKNGFPPENIDRVLRPFEQVENSYARKHGGSGLGLPYAKRLVELHGGELKIESELGKGTSVTVSLPAARLIDVRKRATVKEAV